MPPITFKQYPQGPRNKNSATRTIETILEKLAQPLANATLQRNAVLGEWHLQIEIESRIETFNISMLLLHANLSHLVLSDKTTIALSERYVTYQVQNSEDEPDLEIWPGIFQSMLHPLRMALRFYTSSFGEVANQFVRGEVTETTQPYYSPLMIFIVICFINNALKQIPLLMTTSSNHELWRYEFLEKSPIASLQQKQCRSDVQTLIHVLSTAKQRKENANVSIDNSPAFFCDLSEIAYYEDDGDEVLLPAGTLIQFIKPDKDLIKGQIVNTYIFDRDFLHSCTALRDSFEKHLNIQYRDNDETIEIAGVKIARPNHGLAHNTCVALFLPWCIDLLARHAKNARFKEICNTLSDNIIEKLRIVTLFLITGRESEESFFDNSEQYNLFKQSSIQNFLEFAKTSPLFAEKEAINDLSIEGYQHIILFYADQNYLDHLPEEAQDFKLYCLLIRFAHDLHLARCYSAEEFASTLEKSWNLLDVSPRHADVITLLRLVFGCIERMGDQMFCHLNKDFKIVNHEQNYRSPFQLYSSDVKKCDHLLRLAPTKLPNTLEMQDFLDSIQTEREILKHQLPNLLRQIDWATQMTHFLQIPDLQIDLWLSHPKFANALCVKHTLSLLFTRFPERSAEFLTHPNIIRLLKDPLRLAELLRALPHLADSCYEFLDKSKLVDYNILYRIVSVAPSWQSKVFSLDFIIERLLKKPMLTTQIGHIFNVAPDCIRLVLQQPAAIEYIRGKPESIASLLYLAPKDVCNFLPWETVLTGIINFSSLFAVLKTCIDKQDSLLANKENLKLINDQKYLLDTLQLTNGSPRLVDHPLLTSSSGLLFMGLIEGMPPLFCVAAYKNLKKPQFTMRELLHLYNRVPALRASLDTDYQFLDGVNLLADFASLMNQDLDLQEQLLSDPRVINLIQTERDVETIIHYAPSLCGLLLNHPRIIQLLQDPFNVVKLLRTNLAAWPAVREHLGSFETFNDIYNWDLLIQVMPDQYEFFLKIPKLIMLINTQVRMNHRLLLAILSDKNLNDDDARAIIQNVIKIVLEENYHLEFFVGFDTARVILELTPNLLRDLLLDRKHYLLRKRAITSTIVELLATMPEIVVDILGEFSNEKKCKLLKIDDIIPALAIAPHFAPFWFNKFKVSEKTINYAVKFATLLPFLASNIVKNDSDLSLLSHDALECILPFLPVTVMQTQQKFIVELAERHLHSLILYFCIYPAIRPLFMPILYLIEDASCQAQMIESVPIEDRIMVKAHFSQAVISPTGTSSELNRFFSISKKKCLAVDKNESLQNYRKGFNKITPYLQKLEVCVDPEIAPVPSTKQLQIIKKNPNYIGMVLSHPHVDEESRDELITSLKAIIFDLPITYCPKQPLCQDSLLNFWHAFPKSLQPCLGEHYPNLFKK